MNFPAWKYLEGGGLRKNPETLEVLLSKSTAEAALPSYTVGLL